MKLKPMKNIFLLVGIISATIITGCSSYNSYSYAIEGNPIIATPTNLSAAESSDTSYSDQIVQKDTVFYNSLWFNTKSAIIDTNNSQSKLVLSYNLNYLNDDDDAYITINGYASELGTKKLNLQLSKKRANFVKAYLVANGINESRIKIVGYGSSGNNIYPEAKNSNNPSNRRIDIVYTKSAPDNYVYDGKQPVIKSTTDHKILSENTDSQ